MRITTLEWIKPRPNRVRIAAALAFFTGIAGMAGWSLSALPGEVSAARGDELAQRLPDAMIQDTADARSTPVRVRGSARYRMSCAECGVIESVRRIDIHEEMMGSCALGDAAGMRVPGSLIDGGQRLHLVTVADTASGATFGDRGARRVSVTSRHEIVVRFRDGSRQVFDERTPRTLRVGERIQVIAGATGTNG